MCWYCGKAIQDLAPFGRELRCPDCGKDLRACKNCSHFLPGAKGDCAEAKGERPFEKERANFCEWFVLNPALRQDGPGDQGLRQRAQKARSAFDDLFSQ